MPQFILKIDLGNDGMQNSEDISDSLKIIASQIRQERSIWVLNDKIRDTNGNVVGHYEVME